MLNNATCACALAGLHLSSLSPLNARTHSTHTHQARSYLNRSQRTPPSPQNHSQDHHFLGGERESLATDGRGRAKTLVWMCSRHFSCVAHCHARRHRDITPRLPHDHPSSLTRACKILRLLNRVRARTFTDFRQQPHVDQSRTAIRTIADTFSVLMCSVCGHDRIRSHPPRNAVL